MPRRLQRALSTMLGQDISPWSAVTDARLAGAHPHIRAFHEHFEALRAARGALPGMRALDPTGMPKLLPHLVLVDLFEAGRLRPRYRLTGTEVDRLVGANYSGRYYEDIYAPKDLARFLALFRDLIRQAQPLYWTGQLLLRDREFIAIERLICPFAADGRAVDAFAAINVRLDN